MTLQNKDYIIVTEINKDVIIMKQESNIALINEELNVVKYERY
ncbi:MAG: hypothetical protein ACI4VH_04030 [Clostridia bacterium]